MDTLLSLLDAAFRSGHIIDAIVALMVFEAGVLLSLHQRHGRGPGPLALLPMLGAGVALMLAVRAALTDAGWMWVALWLALGGLGHLLDLRARLAAQADSRRVPSGRRGLPEHQTL